MEMVPYLIFNGNCEEAMNFYKDAMGGTIEFMQRFKDAPMPSPEEDKEKVMHGVVKAGDMTLMFSDAGQKHNVTFGDNMSLSMNFHDDASIERAFNAFSNGGTVTMPLQDTFWGAKFGMCKDKFGVNWMFNYDKPKPVNG